MTQPIDCTNFEERINELLDARLRLAGDVELVMHSKSCDQCRVVIEDYRALENCFNTFTPKKLNGLKTPGRYSRPLKRSVAAQSAIYSIVAVLLLGLCLAFGFLLEKDIQPLVLTTKSKAKISANHEALKLTLDSPTPSAIQDQPETTRPAKSKHTLVNWNQISEQLQPLNSYYQLSAELPGIRPIQFSLGITIDWFQQTFFGSTQHQISDPEFGVIIYDENRLA